MTEILKIAEHSVVKVEKPKVIKNGNKVGRKWFDGKVEEDVVAKLKEVWAMGGSNEEACFWADISKYSLLRYIKAKPHLGEIRTRLKEKPILLARQTVIKAIGNDPDIAFKYLERKKRDEFGLKVGLEFQMGEEEKELSKLDKILRIMELNMSYGKEQSENSGEIISKALLQE